MAIYTGLVFLLVVVAIAALCQAGLYKGEQRMLERLNQTLAKARVIDSDVTSGTVRQTQRHRHRQAATKLNTMQDVELCTVEEGQVLSSTPGQSRPAVKPPTPTRTYSLRFSQPRPSLANIKQKMSNVFGGASLIDLDSDVPPPATTSALASFKPEEEGNWV